MTAANGCFIGAGGVGVTARNSGRKVGRRVPPPPANGGCQAVGAIPEPSSNRCKVGGDRVGRVGASRNEVSSASGDRATNHASGDTIDLRTTQHIDATVCEIR